MSEWRIEVEDKERLKKLEPFIYMRCGFGKPSFVSLVFDLIKGYFRALYVNSPEFDLDFSVRDLLTLVHLIILVIAFPFLIAPLFVVKYMNFSKKGFDKPNNFISRELREREIKFEWVKVG